MANQKIYIFALAAQGNGISGSDRIFIEFAKNWSKTHKVEIFVWKEGYKMCQKQGIDTSSIKYQVSSMFPWRNFGFAVNYWARVIEGIRIGFSQRLENRSTVIIYSASEFWMDSLPALILKLRFPNVKWVAGWYQSAPNPLIGFSEKPNHPRYRLSALFYWLVQLPIKPVIDNFSDFVLVNNSQEKIKFSRLNKKNKALVVLGAVDVKKYKKWKSKFSKIRKIYDAIFQGRFHPQKGVVELIDIWKNVVKKKKSARLVLIGDGPLMPRVKNRIENEGLDKNIKLLGYLFDRDKKFKIFSQSKIVVHPSLYDSGGMASLEAMMMGLPCVGFNLSSYKYYFPLGMIKANINDLDNFASKVLDLLSNKNLYKKISKQSSKLLSSKWSWEYRSRQILDQVLE